MAASSAPKWHGSKELESALKGSALPLAESDLVDSTLILAGWTAVLAGATIAYAYYVRSQVVIMREQAQVLRSQTTLMTEQMSDMKAQNSLMAMDQDLRKVEIAINSLHGKHRGDVTKELIDGEIKSLGIEPRASSKK